MPRISDKALNAELTKRGFQSATIRQQSGERIEVEANKLHPLPLPEGEPVYAELPVSLSVEVDKQGRVKSIEGGTPDPAAVNDAMHYLKTLQDTGQLADSAPPPPGATHQIERDDQGRRVLRRKRFSIV